MEIPNYDSIEDAIVHYLDRGGLIENVILAARNHEKSVSNQLDLVLPFRYTIKFNIVDLCEINDRAANLLISEPLQFCHLMEKVVHCAITNFANVEINLNEVRITARVDLSSLPVCLSTSTTRQLPGLFIMRGVLIAVTTLSKYVRSKLYRCPIPECCCGGGRERVYNDWEKTANRCTLTNFSRIEDLAGQEIGDQAKGVLIDPDALNLKPGFSQGTTVYFRDDLSVGLELGGCYQLTVSRTSIGGVSTSLVAWGVQELLPEPQSRMLVGLRLPQFPHSIQRLVNDLSDKCPRSPWAFTAALFSQLGHHLAPMNCFLHLKAGILLSLASQCTKKQQQPCHLMCLGVDGTPLVYHCARLARRTVAPASWPPHHPAGLYRIDSPSGSVWLEAGPLLLASSGVCLLGDWHVYGKQRISEIFHALENGEVCLDTNEYKKTTGSMPSGSPVHPVQSSIWALFNRKNYSNMKADEKAFRRVIELFGIPFIGSCNTTEEIEDFTRFKLSEATVNSGFNAKRNLLVSEKDLREFLDIVSSKTVQISEKASNLLRHYFVSTRASRPGFLPPAAIKIMTALSEAHARIGLRDEVIEDDALFVISLYEEAISLIFGPSMLTNVNSKRPDSSDPIAIAEQVHENMLDFSINIDRNLKPSTLDTDDNSIWSEE